uniref:Transmembrane protein 106 C-terminal domain-containing protein n=1 Tax=Suricata suricatta TaxID=37032 RepID=A0A673SYR3_SURSU
HGGQHSKRARVSSCPSCPLLAAGLVAFFLRLHSGFADDFGIKVAEVTCRKQTSLVILTIMATLKIGSSNFCLVGEASLACQVQYMNVVAGTYVTTDASFISPWSEQPVDVTMKSETEGPVSCVYTCVVPPILKSIVIFVHILVEISYIGHLTQSSLETPHYVGGGANSTAVDKLFSALAWQHLSVRAQHLFSGLEFHTYR